MKAINIKLRCHQMTLPMGYNHLLHGLIYKMFSLDKDFSNFLHDEGVEMFGRTFRPFMFSRLKQLDGNSIYNKEEKSITYNGLVEFEIRSVEDYSIDIICAYLEQNQVVQIGWHMAEVIGYSVVQKRHFGKAHYIRMITPITVHVTSESGQSYFFKPDSEEFYNRIVLNAQKKFYVIAEKEAEFMIYPEKVREQDRNVTSFHSARIEGYKGMYRIEGDGDIIDFLYYAGLGERNSQGFGMFEFDDARKIR